jgi:hypothetical protein
METISWKEYLEFLKERATEKSEIEILNKMIKRCKYEEKF